MLRAVERGETKHANSKLNVQTPDNPRVRSFRF